MWDHLETEVRLFAQMQHLDAYRLIEPTAFWTPRTGLDSDAYDTFAGAPIQTGSIAATGVGLVGLAVAHAEGWDPETPA